MKMSKAFLGLILVLLTTSCATTLGSVEDESQPAFVRMASVPDDKCVVYVYRIPSIVGAAVTHNIQVYTAGESGFPEVGKYVYGYLIQESYIPIVLEANTLYRIHAASRLYFKGNPGSECIYRIEGTERSFSCISGDASAYFKQGNTKETEKLIFEGNKELEKYAENPDSKDIEGLTTTRLSSVIGYKIYK